MTAAARCLVTAAVVCAAASRLIGQTAPNGTGGVGTAPENGSIRADRLRADLMFLAGDGFRGRLTDTPENALALEWIKSRFERLGLKPMGQAGSYFAPNNLMLGALADGNLLEIAADGVTGRIGVGADFYPHRFSPIADAAGPLAFAGFGISAPALGYDDLGGEVRGRILLVLDHEPGETDPASPFDGVVTSEYANPLRKALAAQDRGAAGVLVVADFLNHAGPEDFDSLGRAYWPTPAPRLPRYFLAAWAERLRIPVGQISRALAEQLVRNSGRTLVDLAGGAESRRGTPVVPLAQTVTLRTAITRHIVPDRNVLAMIEGADPALRDEVVIVSSHPDHNGADGAQIWNGADDNGSGTVGVLAIAEAYARAAETGRRPKRSVLFVAFNSEERGPLLGSWGYTEMPAVPLARTVAVINLDMIGRNEEVPEGGGSRFRGLPAQSAEANRNSVSLLGWSRSRSLTAAVERANTAFGLTLKKEYDNNVSNLIRRGDSWPFLQRGVPAIWLNTGLHPDYHTIYDRPEKIDYAKMERIVRLAHQLSWDLAEAIDRPRLDR